MNVSLRLFLLGGFHAERDGQPVPDSAWVRPKAKALVKLLAATSGHHLHREQVEEVLWPDLDPASAYGSFRKALYLARHALEPDLSKGQKSATLQLVEDMLWLSDDVWIDADHFERLAQEALHSQSIEGSERALAAYGGELLPEDRYEDWAITRRDALCELRFRLLLHLATLLEQQSSYNAAIEQLQHALEIDPAAEEVHRYLMRLYATIGNQHRARQQYQLCRAALEEYAGVVPDQETQALYQDIVSGRLTPPARAPASHAASSLPAAIQQPPLVPFLAREQPKALLLAVLGFRAPTVTPHIRSPGAAMSHEAGSWEIPPGNGGLILVSGEAGIGKTRLLAEVAREAHQQGAVVLWGTSHEHEGTVAYGPFVEALTDHLRSWSDADQQMLVSTYPLLARLLLPSLSQRDDLSPSLNPESERSRLYSEVVRFLTDLTRGPSGQRPLLLVLDDLHGADTASLQLLYHLARETHRHRWLIVGTYRGETVAAGSEFASTLAGMLHRDSYRQIDLLGLARAECRTLITALLSSKPDEALLERLYTLTLGNPLFLIQLVRALQERGALQRTEGVESDVVWTFTAAEEDAWAVPQQLRDLILLGVDSLGETARRILALAAVAGREFSFAILAAAAWRALPGHVSEDTVLDTLDRALDMRLLEERQSPQFGLASSDYAFRHPLFQAALYERLSVQRRARFHLAVARTLEEYGCEDVEVLAYHYSQSGDSNRAVIYLERAGDRAAAVYANDMAARYYRELCKHLEALGRPRERARMQEKLGATLALMACTDEALSELEQAADVYRTTGDLVGETRAVACIAQVQGRLGAPREGMARLRPLVEQLERQGPSPTLALSLVTLAHLLFAAGNYREQLRTSERAAEMARSLGDSMALAQAEIRRASALNMLGQLEEGRAVARRAIPIIEAAGDLQMLSRHYNNLAWASMLTGDLYQNRTYIERALETAHRVGDPADIGLHTAALGQAEALLGDLQQARTLIEQGVQLLEGVGASWNLAYAYFYYGELEWIEGDWSEAVRLLETTVAMARESDDLQVLRAAQWALSTIDLWEDRPEAARDRLEPLLGSSDTWDTPRGIEDLDAILVIQTLGCAYQALNCRADTTPAHPRPDRLTAYAVERARALRTNLYLAGALWSHGVVLTGQGRWDEAEAALDEALELVRSMSAVYIEPCLLAAIARLHLTQGRRGRARTRVNEALTILRRIGAHKHIERYQALMG
jgi:DNA-binding SARP family transcriptional activator